jgi:hypothetical protein
MSQAARLSPIRIKNCARRRVVHRSGMLDRQREGFTAPQIGIDIASAGKPLTTGRSRGAKMARHHAHEAL